jgi:hypothetical protein
MRLDDLNDFTIMAYQSELSSIKYNIHDSILYLENPSPSIAPAPTQSSPFFFLPALPSSLSSI